MTKPISPMRDLDTIVTMIVSGPEELEALRLEFDRFLNICRVAPDRKSFYVGVGRCQDYVTDDELINHNQYICYAYLEEIPEEIQEDDHPAQANLDVFPNLLVAKKCPSCSDGSQ